MKNIHFSGVGGFGMSALAQMCIGGKLEVSGSDRDFDRGRNLEVRSKLEKIGVKIYPQDGSAISKNTAKLVLSTAIENTNPEVKSAQKYLVPMVHRSEVLAEFVNDMDSIVIAGTSGKSTVAAMLFCILEYAGLQPSIITGGALNELKKQGLIGNAFNGKGKALVVEGDESDGSLVRYKPKKGLALNITKDHKTLDELKQMFLQFRDNCESFAWNIDDTICSEIYTSGLGQPYGKNIKGWPLEKVLLKPFSSEFYINNVKFSLPVPGQYNIENAISACAGASMYGISLEQASMALAKFSGVERRFNLIGEKNGIKVIDDFAHNPAKISAAISALHGAGKRVFVVYQPHGFTPTKKLQKEIVQSLADGLSKEDFLFMPEIYYAGGTVRRNISSLDIVQDVCNFGKNAKFFSNRAEIPAAIAKEIRKGDIVGVMGARDATLTDLAKDILEKI